MIPLPFQHRPDKRHSRKRMRHRLRKRTRLLPRRLLKQARARSSVFKHWTDNKGAGLRVDRRQCIIMVFWLYAIYEYSLQTHIKVKSPHCYIESAIQPFLLFPDLPSFQADCSLSFHRSFQVHRYYDGAQPMADACSGHLFRAGESAIMCSGLFIRGV